MPSQAQSRRCTFEDIVVLLPNWWISSSHKALPWKIDLKSKCCKTEGGKMNASFDNNSRFSSRAWQRQPKGTCGRELQSQWDSGLHCKTSPNVQPFHSPVPRTSLDTTQSLSSIPWPSLPIKPPFYLERYSMYARNQTLGLEDSCLNLSDRSGLLCWSKSGFGPLNRMDKTKARRPRIVRHCRAAC